jgi:protein gp37
MAENSKIEWTDHTFNPWTGCTKVSPGCDHCYAEGWAKRSGAVRWGVGEPRRRTTEANWRLPLKWNAQADAERRRMRVFCASLADVFDNAVDPQWRADLFSLILSTPNLDWLLLTKRIGNVVPMLRELRHGSDEDLPLLDVMPLENLWLGATVVNQEEADRDIPKLLAVPARVRFLSIEPMLGPIDIRWTFSDSMVIRCPRCRLSTNRLTHGPCPNDGATLVNDVGVDWVIAGGESGPGARPMHPDWARSLRDQCEAAGVPFLFKQWGEWSPWEDRVPLGHDWKIHAFTDGRRVQRCGKNAAGRLLDGVQHDGFPPTEERGNA